MNRKQQIVCIGPSPWAAIPHRTQQLMAHMKGVEILYFSPPSEQITQVSYHRKKVKPHIWVYVLPKDVKKVSKTPMLFSLRQKRLAQFISRTMAKHHIRNPLLWVTHPSQEEITCHLQYDTLVYDCFEPWFEDYSYEQGCLLRKADLIFAASHTLKKEAWEYNRNVALLENGVDYPLFEEASLFAKLSSDEVSLGFAGVIDYDLDLSPLLLLAEKYPQWHIKLLGSCPQGNPYYDVLTAYDNVKFFGEHPVHVIPEFLCCCHILMDFRSGSGYVHDINSMRWFEYFATGRPVVTHIWKDEIERFPDVVYISKTQEEFLKNCEIALKEKPNTVTSRRKNYAKKGAWTKRTERVLQVLTRSHLMYDPTSS